MTRPKGLALTTKGNSKIIKHVTCDIKFTPIRAVYMQWDLLTSK